MLDTLQPSVIASAASAGMIPAAASARASAASVSIIRRTYASSEKISRAAAVPKRFRKTRESIALTFMVAMNELTEAIGQNKYTTPVIRRLVDTTCTLRCDVACAVEQGSCEVAQYQPYQLIGPPSNLSGASSHAIACVSSINLTAA